MDVLPEIRRLHFVEGMTISDLAKQFNLSRPTIRKHLNTVEEPVYPTRQHQPHLKLGAYIEQQGDSAVNGREGRHRKVGLSVVGPQSFGTVCGAAASSTASRALWHAGSTAQPVRSERSMLW